MVGGFGGQRQPPPTGEDKPFQWAKRLPSVDMRWPKTKRTDFNCLSPLFGLAHRKGRGRWGGGGWMGMVCSVVSEACYKFPLS